MTLETHVVSAPGVRLAGASKASKVPQHLMSGWVGGLSNMSVVIVL
jgi:hypothetical protein